MPSKTVLKTVILATLLVSNLAQARTYDDLMHFKDSKKIQALSKATTDIKIDVPQSEDFVGIWERLPSPIEVTESLPEEPWAYEHQWYSFKPNGQYSHLFKKDYQHFSLEQLERLFSKVKQSEFQYEYTNGFLLVNNSIEKTQEVFHVVIAKQKTKLNGFVLDKGDMLLTLVDGASLRQKQFIPLAVRHMRPVKAKKIDLDQL